MIRVGALVVVLFLTPDEAARAGELLIARIAAQVDRVPFDHVDAVVYAAVTAVLVVFLLLTAGFRAKNRLDRI